MNFPFQEKLSPISTLQISDVVSEAKWSLCCGCFFACIQLSVLKESED